MARKFVCGTTNSVRSGELPALAASAGSLHSEAPFFIFPIFHVCSTSKQRTPLPSSLLRAYLSLGRFFAPSATLSVCPLFILYFAMKSDKKISIDIFLKGKDRKKLEQQKKVRSPFWYQRRRFFEKLGLAQENYTIETFFRFPSPSTCHSNIHKVDSESFGAETETERERGRKLWVRSTLRRVNAEIKSAAKVPLGKFKNPSRKLNNAAHRFEISPRLLLIQSSNWLLNIFLRGKISYLSNVLCLKHSFGPKLSFENLTLGSNSTLQIHRPLHPRLGREADFHQALSITHAETNLTGVDCGCAFCEH